MMGRVGVGIEEVEVNEIGRKEDIPLLNKAARMQQQGCGRGED